VISLLSFHLALASDEWQDELASMPLVFVTAWHMLVGLTAVRPGQTVLVLGASAGVGIAAMRGAADLSGPSIRDAIARTKDFEGVGGNITLDTNRNAIKPAVILQVGRGQLKYITSISP